MVDSLVALRLGARLGDHVLETVIPLGILALIFLLRPRLRPGLRGATDLFIGVLALIWAGVAIADAAAGGFGGRHITGFLLVPAGVTLIWLGSAGLVRSRKPGKYRHLRRVGWVILALLVGYWVVAPLGMAAYATHRPRAAVPSLPAGIEHEDVTVSTSDGVQLHGWYIPSKNGAAVLTFPRESTTAHAAMLAGQGYGVLLLDMRGYGESDGDPNALGWGCTKDIDAGIAYLESRTDVEDGRIGGMGLSVGGEQMIEAAAANPALRAVVADGPGERSVKESLIRGPKGYFALPMAAVRTAAVAIHSGQRVPPALDGLAARVTPRALFLIYAENGGGGEELCPDYFAAAGEPKAIWIVPATGHTDGITTQPQEYARRVGDFFAQTLTDEAP